jgi:hypothetical protein
MTIDVINSILFPPFLFILFFSIISGLFYPAPAIADETRMMRKTRPAQAHNRPRIAPRSSEPKSPPPGMRLREVLDELEREEQPQETEDEEAKIPQRI